MKHTTPAVVMAAVLGMAVLAGAIPAAVADESVTDSVQDAVATAQALFTIHGTDAFEQISDTDAFGEFVFVLNATDMVTVASSDFPELEGQVTFVLSRTDYTQEDLMEHLARCDGLWMLYEFTPEPDVTLTEILWLSELDGYIFGSGFFLPELDLPEWLQSWYDEQLRTMVRMLNAEAGCECP